MVGLKDRKSINKLIECEPEKEVINWNEIPEDSTEKQNIHGYLKEDFLASHGPILLKKEEEENLKKLQFMLRI